MYWQFAFADLPLQTVGAQIRPDIVFGLFWVHLKGYKQTTLSKRVKIYKIMAFSLRKRVKIYKIMAWLSIQFLSTFSGLKQYSCCKSCIKQESLKMFGEQNTTEVNLRIVDACSGI